MAKGFQESIKETEYKHTEMENVIDDINQIIYQKFSPGSEAFSIAINQGNQQITGDELMQMDALKKYLNKHQDDTDI